MGQPAEASVLTRLCGMGLGIFAALFPVVPAMADDSRGLYVLNIHQGSDLSTTAETLGNGGYYLSDATTWISFAPWYHTPVQDIFVDMLTQLDDDNGILWSLSTGEHGEKYRINPSLKLGFITQSHPTAHGDLSLTVTSTVLGGSLTELPCEADYGPDGGGVQTVNCRLAATELAPEKTLKYLVKAPPTRLGLQVTYRVNF